MKTKNECVDLMVLHGWPRVVAERCTTEEALTVVDHLEYPEYPDEPIDTDFCPDCGRHIDESNADFPSGSPCCC